MGIMNRQYKKIKYKYCQVADFFQNVLFSLYHQFPIKFKSNFDTSNFSI